MIAGLCAIGFLCIGLSIYLIIRHIDENILLWLNKEDKRLDRRKNMAVNIEKMEIRFCPLCDKTEKRKGVHIFSDDYSFDIKFCEEHFVEFRKIVNSIK